MISALGWCLGFGLGFRCLEQITGVVGLFLGLYLAQVSLLNENSVVRPATAEVPTQPGVLPVGQGSAFHTVHKSM